MLTPDLTRGPILRSVVLFAVPLLGTSVVQQLYSTVDLLFVGNVLGTHATAALGIGAMLLTLLSGFFIGVSVGVNVKVAHLVGARDDARLRKALPAVGGLSFACGLALVVVGEVAVVPFVHIMETPAESVDLAIVYLRFAVATALPIAVYNGFAGALRGLGNSRLPLLAQVAGGIVNIVANWLALCVLGWGIAGCAFATFTSNMLAAVLAAVLLARLRGGLRMLSGFTHDAAFIKDVLLFGLPIGAQTVAITLSNVAVQYQVDLLGVQAVAAFSIYFKVELPIYYVILAIGQATTTFVAQNHGAGLHGRCQRGIRICQVLCLGLAIAMSAIMLAVGYWAFWLFDRSEDVIAVGLSIIWTTFPFYFFYAILEVQGDAMRGFGHSLAPALVVFANICVLRVVLVFAVAAFGLGVWAIALTYPITWASTAACMVVLRMALDRSRGRLRAHANDR